MLSLTGRSIPGFLLLGVYFLSPLHSQAQSFTRENPIVDKAGLFSKDAVAKATNLLKKMASQQSREMVVETFPIAPEEIQKTPSGEITRISQLFKKWARQRANALSVNGVYVLICARPHYVQPLVGENTEKYGFFSAEDTRKLGKILRDQLKANNADGALLQGVEYVSSTLKNRAGRTSKSPGQRGEGGPNTPGEPKQTSWLYYIGIAVLIFLGLWILIGLFRAFRGGSAGPGEMAGGQGENPPTRAGGGGGFVSSLLGGMLGGMAGAWAYNQFFGGQHSATTPTSNQSDNSSIPTDVGGDYDDAGAGDYYAPEDQQTPSVPDDDFGGGDFDGGEDFGGGDFDGGGDFGGDGGGDW